MLPDSQEAEKKRLASRFLGNQPAPIHPPPDAGEPAQTQWKGGQPPVPLVQLPLGYGGKINPVQPKVRLASTFLAGAGYPLAEIANDVLGYTPNFWEYPQRVARMYLSYKAAPPGTTPAWLNMDRLETAYNYLKARNDGAPWYEWKFLPADDPGRDFLNGMGMPPEDALDPRDLAYLRAVRAAAGLAPDGTPLTGQGEPAADPRGWPYTQYPKYDQLPGWHKLLVNLMGNSENPLGRIASATVGGGVMGAVGGAVVGGPVGAAAGALGGGAFGLVTSGAHELTEGPWVTGRLAQSPAWVRSLAQVPQGGLGVLEQALMVPVQLIEFLGTEAGMASGSLMDPDRYGPLSEVLDLGANWEASKLLMPSLYGMLSTRYPEQATRGLDLGRFPIAPEQGGETRVFQLGEPELVTLPSGTRVGLDAVVEARERIQEAKSPEEIDQILGEVGGRFGFGGQAAQLLGEALLFSKLHTGELESRGIYEFARRTNRPLLAEAALASQRTHHPGVFGTSRMYGVLARDMAPAEMALREGWLGRMLGGLNRDGTPKAVSVEEAKGIRGVVRNMFGLNPQARAQELAALAGDGMGALLTDTGDLDVPAIVGRLKSAFNMPDETAARLGLEFLDTPNGGIFAKELGQEWAPTLEDSAEVYAKASEFQIPTLRKLARALGITEERFLERLGTEKDSKALLGQLMQEVKARAEAGDQGAAEVLRLIQTGQLTDASLRDMFKTFVTDQVPYTTDMWKAQVFDSWMSFVRDHAIARYGVKPATGILAWSRVGKQVQSALLLDYNGLFVAINAANNLGTMVIDGVFQLAGIGKEIGWWRRLGLTPFRLRQAFGGPSELASEAARGTIKAPTWEQHVAEVQALTANAIRAAERPQGRAGRAEAAVVGFRHRFGLGGRLAGFVEGASSIHATTTAAKGFMSAYWRRGAGFDEIPHEIRAVLGETLTGMVHGQIERSLNNTEIDAHLLGPARMRASVETFIDDAARALGKDPALVRESMSKSGVLDFINAKIDAIGATPTPEQVRDVFYELNRWRQERVLELAKEDAKVRMLHRAAQIKAGDWEGMLGEAFDFNRRMAEEFMAHTHRVSEAMADARATNDPVAARQLIATALANENQRMTQLQEYETSVYDGMVEGMRELGIDIDAHVVGALEAPSGAHPKFLDLVRGRHETWRDFFRLRDETWRDFFDRLHNKGFKNRAQSDAAYTEATEKLDRAYGQAAQAEIDNMRQEGMALVRLVEGFDPDMADRLGVYVEDMVQIHAAQMVAEQKIRRVRLDARTAWTGKQLAALIIDSFKDDMGFVQRINPQLTQLKAMRGSLTSGEIADVRAWLYQAYLDGVKVPGIAAYFEARNQGLVDVVSGGEGVMQRPLPIGTPGEPTPPIKAAAETTEETAPGGLTAEGEAIQAITPTLDALRQKASEAGIPTARLDGSAMENHLVNWLNGPGGLELRKRGQRIRRLADLTPEQIVAGVDKLEQRRSWLGVLTEESKAKGMTLDALEALDRYNRNDNQPSPGQWRKLAVANGLDEGTARHTSGDQARRWLAAKRRGRPYDGTWVANPQDVRDRLLIAARGDQTKVDVVEQRLRAYAASIGRDYGEWVADTFGPDSLGADLPYWQKATARSNRVLGRLASQNRVVPDVPAQGFILPDGRRVDIGVHTHYGALELAGVEIPGGESGFYRWIGANSVTRVARQRDMYGKEWLFVQVAGYPNSHTIQMLREWGAKGNGVMVDLVRPPEMFGAFNGRYDAFGEAQLGEILTEASRLYPDTLYQAIGEDLPRLIANYGVTTNPADVGWITPDGQMVDLKRSDFKAGVGHPRSAIVSLPDEAKWSHDGVDAVTRLQQRNGVVRVDAWGLLGQPGPKDVLVFDIYGVPTTAQVAALEDIVTYWMARKPGTKLEVYRSVEAPQPPYESLNDFDHTGPLSMDTLHEALAKYETWVNGRQTLYQEQGTPPAARGRQSEWFWRELEQADPVVKHPDGAPRVFYHGTPDPGFDRADPSASSTLNLYGPAALYVTDDARIAGGIPEKQTVHVDFDTREQAENAAGRNYFVWQNPTTGKFETTVERTYMRMGYSTARVPEAMRERYARQQEQAWIDRPSEEGYYTRNELRGIRGAIDRFRADGDLRAYADFMANYGVPPSEIMKNAQLSGLAAPGAVYPLYLLVKKPLMMDVVPPPVELEAMWAKAEASGQWDAMSLAAAKAGMADYLASEKKPATWGEFWRAMASADPAQETGTPRRSGPEVTNDFLRAQGYDSFVHRGGGRVQDEIGHQVVVVLEPSAIKSVFNSNASDDPRFLYQLQEPAILEGERLTWAHSRAAAVVRAKMPARMPPDQLEAMLKGAQIRQDELTWSGVESLIEKAKAEGRQLTREEVLATLNPDAGWPLRKIRAQKGGYDSADDVRIRNVSDEAVAEESYQLPLVRALEEGHIDEARYRQMIDEHGADDKTLIWVEPDTQENLYHSWEVEVKKVREPGYWRFTITGSREPGSFEIFGEDGKVLPGPFGRETVDLRGANGVGAEFQWIKEAADAALRWHVFTMEPRATRYEDYTMPPGGKDYQEWLFTYPAERPVPGTEFLSTPATIREDSPHFEATNIVVHVRSDKRPIAGQRSLFIEEIQSDSHERAAERVVQPADQYGQRVGYKPLEFYRVAQAEVAARKDMMETMGIVPNVEGDWHNRGFIFYDASKRAVFPVDPEPRAYKPGTRLSPLGFESNESLIYDVVDAWGNRLGTADTPEGALADVARDYLRVGAGIYSDKYGPYGGLDARLPTPEEFRAIKAYVDAREAVARGSPELSHEGQFPWPFKQTYHELAMKDALAEAARDPSIDTLSWTPGDVQIDRYGRPQVEWRHLPVDGTRMRQFEEGQWEVSYSFGTSGHTSTTLMKDLTPSEIAGLPGELGGAWGYQLLERMKAQPESGSWEPMVEGMAKFYDHDLPAFLEKLGRPFGIRPERVRAGGVWVPNMVRRSTDYSVLEVHAPMSLDPRAAGPAIARLDLGKNMTASVYRKVEAFLRDAPTRMEEGWSPGIITLDLGDKWVGWVKAGRTSQEVLSLGYERAGLPIIQAAQAIYQYGQTHAVSPEVWSFKITPELRKFVTDNGFELYQGGLQAKGATRFLNDGRAVMRFFEAADFSTAVHEIGHIMRRQLTPEHMTTVVGWLADQGIKVDHAEGLFLGDEGAVRLAEERFARAFERYVYEGVAPKGASARLVAAFEAMKGWMISVYKNLRGSSIDVPISEAMRDLFDRIWGNEEGVVTAKADLAGEAAAQPIADPPRVQVEPPPTERRYVQTEAGVRTMTPEERKGGITRLVRSFNEPPSALVTAEQDGYALSHNQRKWNMRQASAMDDIAWYDNPRLAIANMRVGEKFWMPSQGSPGATEWTLTGLTDKTATFTATQGLGVQGRQQIRMNAIAETAIARVFLRNMESLMLGRWHGVDAGDLGRAIERDPLWTWRQAQAAEGGRPAPVEPVEGVPMPTVAEPAPELSMNEWAGRRDQALRAVAGLPDPTERIARARAIVAEHDGIRPQAGGQLPNDALLNDIMAKAEAQIRRETTGIGGLTGGGTWARGMDPTTTYQFRWRVMDIADPTLVVSLTPEGKINPAYPQEFQPRERTRVASSEWIRDTAERLVPAQLIDPTARIDDGAPIIGADGIVESGNGRLSALRRAAVDVPAKMGEYRSYLLRALTEHPDVYGIDPDAAAKLGNPVLVRERLSEIDRRAFVEEANGDNKMAMSFTERARSDATKVDDELMGNLQVRDEQPIEEALRSPSNRTFVQSFLERVPAVDRGAMADAKGNLSVEGMRRIVAALFAKAFPGEPGQRLIRLSFESLDNNVRNVTNGIAGALGPLARLEAMIAAGLRESHLSLGEDLAMASTKFATLRSTGMSVADFLAQGAMFGRELTPFQETLLAWLGENARSPRKIRDVLEAYAGLAIRQGNARQGSLFGENVARPTKDAIWGAALGQSMEVQQLPEQMFPGPVDQVPKPLMMSDLYDEGWENLRPVLETLKQRMSDPEAMPRSIGNDEVQAKLTPDQQRQFREYLERVKGQLASTKLAAVRYGEAGRDFSLLNYQAQRGLDPYAQVAWPYELWPTRTATHWAQRTVDRPALLANYLRYQHLVSNFSNSAGFPTRLQGKIRIPMPWLPDWMGGGLWVDPLQGWFAPDMFANTYQRAAGQLDRDERKAETILRSMQATGDADPRAVALALSEHSGELWKQALSQARQENESELGDITDYMNLLTGYALPFEWARQFLRGTPERISQLPITRTVRNLTAGLGINNGAGWNLEGPLRRAIHLPEVDRFEDYRVARMLSNMAGDGEITADQASEALNGEAGPVYGEAVNRVNRQRVYGTVANPLYWFGFTGDAFPTGEAVQRENSLMFQRAMAAYELGDATAMRKFWDTHPEYAARIDSLREPDDMLRTFLVDRVWEAWNAMGSTQKEVVSAQLGQDFEDAFLNRETRNYEGIPLQMLALWAQQLGGMLPERVKEITGTQAGVPPLTTLSPDVAQEVDDYRAARAEKYPEWYMLQSLYYSYPAGGVDRRNLLVRFPRLLAYWKWNRDYKRDHPTVAAFSQRLDLVDGAGNAVMTLGMADILANPILMRQLAASEYGQPMTAGALAELRRIWEASGEPTGDFNLWVRTVVAVAK